MSTTHIRESSTPVDLGSWPHCGGISGVQPIIRTSSRVQAPQLHLDRLAATVQQLNAARLVLRQVITLADDADTLTDQELRARLLTLARGAG